VSPNRANSIKDFPKGTIGLGNGLKLRVLAHEFSLPECAAAHGAVDGGHRVPAEIAMFDVGYFPPNTPPDKVSRPAVRPKRFSRARLV
jgi:hypothetical protein